MASVPLSSLSLAHRRRPADAALTFSSSDLSFRSGSVGFGLAKKNQRVRVSVCRASSFVFRNLDADDFRHPLDKQNTLILRAIPGLNELGKALLGSVTEQIMLLENIGTSVLVSKNQLSELHQLMTEAAQILNMEAPDLYVRQSPVPNAYTLAISGKKPFVVLHTSLVELLTRKGVAGCLGSRVGSSEMRSWSMAHIC
ncbi:hypothetical protein OIU77_016337 [Salix suchowensis]|uniref:Peptidase M48 domain-containing protein n=1 Tax=Salix suchowensis TaxID=1278906 RepID=A0ABQ8ZK93_9ROSI|nr:hypothetical protein OIU77_016337 [Salix suchowensis]